MIYEHESLLSFIEAFIAEKSDARKTFSYRAIARRLPQVSHSQLFQMLKGRKKFSKRIQNAFASKILKLDLAETRYFAKLVDLNHALLDRHEKSEIAELRLELKALVPLEIRRIRFNRKLSDPLVMLIFIMLERPDVRAKNGLSPGDFRIPVNQRQIDDALRTLIESGHIGRDAGGRLEKKTTSLMSFDDVPNPFVREYHKQISRIAAETIDRCGIDDREFQSYMINLDPARLPQAKRLIRDFMQSFGRKMAPNDDAPNPKKTVKTFGFNLQLFPTA